MIETTGETLRYCPRCGTRMMHDVIANEGYCPWCGGAGNRRALQPVTLSRMAADRLMNRRERRALAAKERRR